MPTTDPISDLLTRIRNAARAGKMQILAPASSFASDVLRVIKQEGYIDDFQKQEGANGFPEFVITLRRDRMNVQLKRVSKPGRRVYVEGANIPKVMSGLGVAVISTSKGVMSHREAKKANVGGELLCEIW